jgi:hypothetical protein
MHTVRHDPTRLQPCRRVRGRKRNTRLPTLNSEEPKDRLIIWHQGKGGNAGHVYELWPLAEARCRVPQTDMGTRGTRDARACLVNWRDCDRSIFFPPCGTDQSNLCSALGGKDGW